MFYIFPYIISCDVLISQKLVKLKEISQTIKSENYHRKLKYEIVEILDFIFNLFNSRPYASNLSIKKAEVNTFGPFIEFCKRGKFEPDLIRAKNF